MNYTALILAKALFECKPQTAVYLTGVGYQSFSKHKDPNDLACGCCLSARRAFRMAEKTMVAESLLRLVEKLCQFWYRVIDMKTSIHPDNYRLVVFDDEAAGFSFLTRSTAPTNETIKWEDGNEYPVVKIHISSASHPFFTGEEKIIDTEGRVDRFAAKMKAAAAHREELAKKAAAAKAKAEQLAAEAKQAVEDAEAKDA